MQCRSRSYRKSIMKVLFGGHIKIGNQEASLFKAFTELRVDLSIINFEDHFKLSFLNRAFNKIGFTKVPRYFGVRSLNENLIKQALASRPDFILLFKPILILPETVRRLARVAKVYSWYPDYILFPKTCSSYFCEAIPLYDCHFSFSLENANRLLEYGAKKSIFLPCAADISCHMPVKVTEEEKKSLGADIVFVGTFVNEERFWYLEKLCQEGYNIKIYGNSWEKFPQNSCLVKTGCIQFRQVCCKEMSKVFNASKIVLSFLRKHNKDVLTCRSYEIPACGAFMLHERTPEATKLFQEDQEASFFDSYEEMKKKIDFYLKNEDLRLKVAQAGYKKIVEGGHLFANRIQDIIAVHHKLSRE